MDYVLVYIKGDGEGKIFIYLDIDYGGCLDSRKLTGGYVIFKGENVIAWYLKLQNLIILFLIESKYVVLSETARELIWYI